MNRKIILELGAVEARQFFLKHESYCNIDLPRYFSFSKLLKRVSDRYQGKKLLSDFSKSRNAIGVLGGRELSSLRQ